MDQFTLLTWVLVFIATLVAGFVKGTVGFAMPTIMISLFASLMAPDVALAALVVPTLLANLWQSLRGGISAARESARKHWRFITMIMVSILLSAQLVSVLPPRAMYLILGVPVVGFSLAQLFGWQLHIAPKWHRQAELGIGGVAGAIGGISGVWGPPTVMYLTALDTPKTEHIRVQGVVYGLGAVVFAIAHVQSGVLNAQTLPLSLAVVVPAGIGLVIGFAAQDKLDQARFKRVTLFVLVLAGANLLRRGIMG